MRTVTERIPLVGSLTDRLPIALLGDSKDQIFQNCFIEIVTNPLTRKVTLVLNKRQGCTASSDVQSGATGRAGAIVWTSNSATAAPTIFSYKKTAASSMMFFNTAGTQIGGDVTNTTNCLSMNETLISSTGNLTAMLLDGSTIEAWFFPEGGAWTQITDSDFPANVCPEHAHMDGFMFVITERGVIHHSDINSLSSWTAGNSINATAMPDNGVGLARYKDFIVAFGDYSTQFFYNAGNATGSVLRRVEGGTFRIGALRFEKAFTTGGRTIMPIGDTVYFLGTNSEGGARGVFRLKGVGAEKISTSAVDKMVSTGGISHIAGAFSMLGMTHIVFTQIGSTTAMCYCVDTNFWWKISFGGSLVPIAFAGSALLAGTNKTANFSTLTNAKIYTFADNGYQDDSQNFTLTVQTQNLDHGTAKRKSYRSLRLIGDVAGATAVAVSYSDDDYSTFSTARNISMATHPSSALKNLQSSRRRAWKITNAENSALRLEAFELEFEVNESS